jgi:hypothetical protein
MVQNVSSGVIISDNSLVLQGVTRHNAGDYTCMAANGEGKGTSNPVELRVMCKYRDVINRFDNPSNFLEEKLSF